MKNYKIVIWAEYRNGETKRYLKECKKPKWTKVYRTFQSDFDKGLIRAFGHSTLDSYEAHEGKGLEIIKL